MSEDIRRFWRRHMDVLSSVPKPLWDELDAMIRADERAAMRGVRVVPRETVRRVAAYADIFDAGAEVFIGIDSINVQGMVADLRALVAAADTTTRAPEGWCDRYPDERVAVFADDIRSLVSALDRVTRERDAEYYVRKCVLWALEGQGLPKELPEHGYGVIEMAHRMRTERDAATTAERDRIRHAVAGMVKPELPDLVAEKDDDGDIVGYICSVCNEDSQYDCRCEDKRDAHNNALDAAARAITEAP